MLPNTDLIKSWGLWGNHLCLHSIKQRKAKIPLLNKKIKMPSPKSIINDRRLDYFFWSNEIPNS